MTVKRSYLNKKISERQTLEEMFTPPEASEGLSSGANKGVGRGLVMPGEPTQPPTIKETEEQNLPLLEPVKKPNELKYSGLMDLFIELGDALDDDGLHSEADFFDFLIVKIAESQNDNYSLMFKNLLIKIVKSDLANSQDVVKKIVNNYNNIIIKNLSQNIDKKESEKIAYYNSLEMANKYVTNIY